MYRSDPTYGFRPDSVEALTPKKYASMADRLSQGYKTAMAMIPKLRMYASKPSCEQSPHSCLLRNAASEP